MRGETLGHYRVLEQLGAGGMGEVYLAEDSTLKRRVALKILPEEFSSDPERLDRFQLEAETLATLNHPNIVTVYSVEVATGPSGRDLRFLAMELVKGRALDRAIPEQGFSLMEFFQLAEQLTEGTAAAHARGIIHRDLKPQNVMIGDDGRVKILDFGLAKLRDQAGHNTSASDLPTALVTQQGRVLGTPAYMAPEQAEGREVGARADVFALGAILYQMLTGKRAFQGESVVAVQAAILSTDPTPLAAARDDLPGSLIELIERCLSKDPAERFSSAEEVAEELARLGRAQRAEPGLGDRPRKGRLLLPVATLALVLAVVAGWLFLHGQRTDRARKAIPEVLRLIGENRMLEGTELALEIERTLGSEPALETVWPQMSSPFKVTTDPPGAEVSYRPYESSPTDWRALGRTPYEAERFPVGAFRFRIEMAGYEPIQVARSLMPALQLAEVGRVGFDYLADPSYVVDLRLKPEGAGTEDMVEVSGGLYGTVPVLGFPPIDPRVVPEFLIDRTEVTNADYLEFVTSGGYGDPSVWQEPFVRDGEALAWEVAVASFKDATDRSGPAAWVLGRPSDGTDTLPVAGVSWFEAAAYCRWRGKSLPTLYHWARAVLPSSDPWIPFNAVLARASNLADERPVPVGSSDAIGISGAHDLAGNVREWVSTARGGRRYLLGGAWSDPAYFVHDAHAADPWQRSEADGFRCASYPEGDAPEHLRGVIELPPQDLSVVTELPDAVFETMRSFMQYDRSAPLDAKVDSSVELEWGAIEEWVSIESAYGERLPIRLHLPRNAEPPFQALVYFGGGNVLRSNRIEDLRPHLSSLVRAGRAVVEPVYDGAFQRNDGRTLQRLANEASSRELLTHWIQDLGRTLDYLEQRSDFDGTQAAYLGLSLGAVLVPRLVAYEPRFRAAILYSGGYGTTLPQSAIERDISLTRRIRIPILMLGGRSDFSVPIDPYQSAMHRNFGTPDQDKHFRIYEDAGHWPLPMNEVLRETVDFLDRYVGPVTTH